MKNANRSRQRGFLLNPFRYGGSGSGGVSARYWRLMVYSSNGGSNAAVGEMYLMFGGSDIVTSGKTYNQSAFLDNPGYYSMPASKMFNGSLSNWDQSWVIPVGSLPAWGSIDMGAPVTLDSFGIAISTGHTTSEAAKAFTLQYSTNNTTWLDAKIVTNQTGWTLGSAGRRNFTF